MAKKYLSKKQAFEIISSELREVGFQCKADMSIVDKSICQKIASALKNTKYGFCSTVHKIITQNKEFMNYFWTLNSKGALCMNKDDVMRNLRQVIQDCAIDPDECANYRRKASAYKTILKELHMKDNFRNRIRIYIEWRRQQQSPSSFQIKSSTPKSDNTDVGTLSEREQLFCENRTNTTDTSNTNSSPKDGSKLKKIFIFDDGDDSRDHVQFSSETPSISRKIPNLPLARNSPSVPTVNGKNIPPHHTYYEMSDEVNGIQGDRCSNVQISPKNRSIPKQILNLSSPGKSPPILLANAHNVLLTANRKTVNYKDCTVFEGSFVLNNDVWNLIFDDRGCLVKKYYPYLMRNRIKKYVNNVCMITFKYVVYTKKRPEVVIFGLCKHNQYRCKKFKIVIDKCDKMVRVYSTSLDYIHKLYLTRNIKGIERDIFKTELATSKAFTYKKKMLLKASKSSEPLKEGKNLQDIVSDGTMRKIRFESHNALNRDKEDLTDMIMMQQDHVDFIRELSIPFNIKLYSIEQLQVLKSESHENAQPFIYFDATGGIIKRPEILKENKRIYFYTAVIVMKRTKRIFPIFSMISEIHNSNAIFKLFSDFRYFCEENNFWPSFSGVVTDFSFANIHAACKAFNRCTLKEYLTQCYNMALNDEKIEGSTLIGIHLCCAHFIKMMCKGIDNLARNVTQKLYFKDVMAAAILIQNWKVFCSFMIDVYVVLKSSKSNAAVRNAKENLGRIHSQGTLFDYDRTFEHLETHLEQHQNADASLSKSSPFYVYFSNLIETIPVETSEPIENEYYNSSLFDLILNKYIPYLPLWTALLLQCRSVSNCYVENYFGQLKKITLSSERNIRCSRFVRLLREDILSLSIESTLGIGKTRLTKEVELSEEKLSQETWSKKKRKTDASHFKGKYLKCLKAQTPSQSENVIFAEDDIDLAVCGHCGQGIQYESLAWVLCDQCDRWYHLQCTHISGEADLSRIDFVCTMCSIDVQQKGEVNTSLAEKCDLFLKKYIKSERELTELQRSTRNQSSNPIWYQERKMRLTSSFFGKICKIRKNDPDTIHKMISDIIQQRNVNTPATIHGKQCENRAREAYSQKTQTFCQLAGLFVHKRYQFLAASPDGLVGEEGLVEIKSPYKARNSDPNTYVFDFLYPDGSLKITHDYFYQIQGQLEITNRLWCDLVIYTFQGIKIIRINRKHRFWKSIIDKLKFFHMFYMLPYLIDTNNKLLNSNERKWSTIKELHFLQNGLVDDIDYYKELESKRAYVVTCDVNIDFAVKQIMIDDFLTLNPNQYLSSFIIDHCLNIINNDNGCRYQIVSVEKSSLIFSDEKLNDYFLDSISFKDGKDVVFPIYLARNRHYVLLVASHSIRRLLLIDSLGCERIITNGILTRFIALLQGKGIPHGGYAVETLKHILQQDSFNCGVYVIYYFQCLASGKSVDIPVDINSLRDIFKKRLLTNSSDMTHICIFCSTVVDNTEYFKCRTCRRYIHYRCLLTGKEVREGVTVGQKTLNGICDVCRIN